MPISAQTHQEITMRYVVLAFLAATALTAGSLIFFARNDAVVDEGRGIRRLASSSSASNLAQFTDPKSVLPRADAPIMINQGVDGAGGANMPNVIYLQHESLSGAIMLNTAEGRKAMPWFNKMKEENPDFYVFEGGRTGSGFTKDALPALHTGCLPFSNEAADWVHTPGRPIGYDFINRGYETASFCSRALDNDITKGSWSMLYDLLAGQMGYVVDPLSAGWDQDNSEGSDDRKMLSKFEEWVAGVETGKPLYAQFYNFNQHYPYVKEKKKPGFKHRYFDSLATTDEFLQRVFEILENSGRLENTIIVGSGDHGEDPFKSTYVRLSVLNSNILHTAHYMYYPRHLMADPSMADRLRRNTQKMTHTLDMYPTIQSAFHGGYYNPIEHLPQGCITGVDLTSVDIPDDRVTIAWNLVSSQSIWIGKRPLRLWALSTRDSSGNDWTLYHRLSKAKHAPTKQGTNNAYILEYGDCTKSTAKSNLCQKKVSAVHKQIFRNAVEWVKHTPLFGEGVGHSELVEFFGKMVGSDETAVAV